MKNIDVACDELNIAIGLIGTGNPAAHKLQCAISDLTNPMVYAESEALTELAEAAALLPDDHAALPFVASAEQLVMAAIAERAQEEGRLKPPAPKKRRKKAAPKKAGRKKRAAL